MAPHRNAGLAPEQDEALESPDPRAPKSIANTAYKLMYTSIDLPPECGTR